MLKYTDKEVIFSFPHDVQEHELEDVLWDVLGEHLEEEIMAMYSFLEDNLL